MYVRVGFKGEIKFMIYAGYENIQILEMRMAM